jgi:hypothetical protein
MTQQEKSWLLVGMVDELCANMDPDERADIERQAQQALQRAMDRTIQASYDAPGFGTDDEER